MTTRAKTRRFSALAAMVLIAVLAVFVVFWTTTTSASADNGPDNWDSFGLDAATAQATDRAGTVKRNSMDVGDKPVYEASALTNASSINISAGIATIEEEERAAEEERRRQEEAAIAAAEEAKIEYEAMAPATNLSEVDWSVGKDAFVSEWAGRIDNYLAGSPLAGYGETFAEAAWNNHVDPRFSPAISNTESSKGSVCFKSHNAWGWGSSGFSDWETAINAHVAGLAAGYGYSITPDGAAKYCPPNCVNWYNKTLAQMETI